MSRIIHVLHFEGQDIHIIIHRGSFYWIAHELSGALGKEDPSWLSWQLMRNWNHDLLPGADYVILKDADLHQFGTSMPAHIQGRLQEVQSLFLLSEMGVHLTMVKLGDPKARRLRHTMLRLIPELHRKRLTLQSSLKPTQAHRSSPPKEKPTPRAQPTTPQAQRATPNLSVHTAPQTATDSSSATQPSFPWSKAPQPEKSPQELAPKAKPNLPQEEPPLEEIKPSEEENEERRFQAEQLRILADAGHSAGRITSEQRLELIAKSEALLHEEPPNLSIEDRFAGWLSPTQIAKRYFVSTNRIGRVISTLSLKGENEAGIEGLSHPFLSKSRYSDRQVTSYRYSPEAIEMIRDELSRQGHLKVA